MNKLDIFKGVDNGQEIIIHSCLHRYSVSAGYFEVPVIKQPISEMEETLICRMPIEKSASPNGFENLFFSECFLRVKKHIALDGMLIEAGTKDVQLSLFQALRWYVANIGKTVVWENLNVEICKRRFGLRRQEQYKTADFNSAEKQTAVSYSAADCWAKVHCSTTAEGLVVWLSQKMGAFAGSEAMQVKI